MSVAWLTTISNSNVDIAGGKGASLGELHEAGLPVPSAFVVTADTYRTFIEQAGIAEKLFDAVGVDSENSAALAEAEQKARELILNAEIPDSVESTILDAHADFQDETFVAVRSSATAEDLPDASFAGQQETFLNVDREKLIDRIKRCWASLFTQRAIYYRDQQGFDHETVDIAVIVQRMVDAEKSGVMFTSHPSTGEPEITIEAAWGLGEAVVSGEVSPDNYTYDREANSLETVTVATKKTMHVREPETGETLTKSVPDDKQTERVLDNSELDDLHRLGELVEEHYGQPQDVEWAINGDQVFLLQSRPITTIDESRSNNNSSKSMDGISSETERDRDQLVDGLGASPGTATGAVRIVSTLDQLDKVNQGDIIVTEMTTPDMVPAMKRAAALVTDEGGMTSHAAIVSRELGVPAVIGTETATQTLTDDQMVSIDGDRGVVADGKRSPDSESSQSGKMSSSSTQVMGDKPMTATDIKVNVSIPEAAKRAAATDADGVGLLRMEHMILSTNKTPEKYVADHGADAFVNTLADAMRTVAEAFYPRSVRVRTLDAPTDEYRQLEGGNDEPHEHNPMLGYRGIRRSLATPETFKLQLMAFQKLYKMGYGSLELMFPLVNDSEDVYKAKNLMEEVGIDPNKRNWGVMVETPASALCIEEICKTGIDFVSLGTNDLTQYTLAVDRNNGTVANRYDELHPAVMQLIRETIETCRSNDIASSICGQAASKPQMIQQLVKAGITSISVNVDAVCDAQREAKRVEQRLILESALD